MEAVIILVGLGLPITVLNLVFYLGITGYWERKHNLEMHKFMDDVDILRRD